MSNTGERLLAAVLALPEQDRAELAARLIDSLDSESDSGWAAAWD